MVEIGVDPSVSGQLMAFFSTPISTGSQVTWGGLAVFLLLLYLVSRIVSGD